MNAQPETIEIENQEIELAAEETNPAAQTPQAVKGQEPTGETVQAADEIEIDTSEPAKEQRSKTEINRESRRERKLKREHARLRLEQENLALRQQSMLLERRVNELAQSMQQNQSTVLNDKISDVRAAIGDLNSQLADAVERADGATVVRVQGELNEANDVLRQLTYYKESRAKAQPQNDQAAQTRGRSAESFANEFIKRNPWLAEASPEEASLSRTLGETLLAQGFRVNDGRYWQAYEAELKRRFDYRYQQDDGDEEDQEVTPPPIAIQAKPNGAVNGQAKIPVAGAGNGSANGTPHVIKKKISLQEAESSLTPAQRDALKKLNYTGDRRLGMIKQMYLHNQQQKQRGLA